MNVDVIFAPCIIYFFLAEGLIRIMSMFPTVAEVALGVCIYFAVRCAIYYYKRHRVAAAFRDVPMADDSAFDIPADYINKKKST